MKLKKITSFLLVCLLTLSIASCRKKSGEEDTDLKDPLDQYVITVDYDFNCDDADMADFFDQLENNNTVIYFRDGNFKAENVTEINDGNKNVIYDTYTVIDGVVYEHFRYYLNDILYSDSKVKALIDAERKTELVEKMCLVGGISAEGFSEVKRESKDGVNISTYSAPATDEIITLERMVISLLEGQCESVSLKDATLVVENKDERYSQAIVECRYEVRISGKTYTASVAVRLSFNYAESFEIALPFSSVDYTEVDLEDIIG